MRISTLLVSPAFGDFPRPMIFIRVSSNLKCWTTLVADHLRAGLGQHAILVRITAFGGGGHDSQAEFILFQEFPGLIERLFILEFRIVGLVENVLRVAHTLLVDALRWQLRNLVLSEF